MFDFRTTEPNFGGFGPRFSLWGAYAQSCAPYGSVLCHATLNTLPSMINMRIQHMLTRGRNKAVNQLELFDKTGKHFYSYGSKIATIDGDRTILYEPYWNFYSATTNRYLLDFLGEWSIKDVRQKVKEGIYEVKQ